MAGQFLSGRRLSTAADVVRALGAVQAQDYAGAKWALAQRTRGVTDADVERELSAGRILRTHVLRPTWHFVAPEDIRWMLALTAPRVNAAMAYHGRVHNLNASVFQRSNDAIANALSGGRHLTRPELGAALERAGLGITSGQRLAHLVMRAELDAVVCSGALRGKQFTYALLDERVPPAAPLERDEALTELARRYFTTRGPATARDFAWWSGLAMTDVKRALQIIQPELKQRSGEQHDAWFAPRSLPKHVRSAHLLSNYDEYFIGYKDRGAVGERIGHTRPVIGGNARITHVVFVDGQLVGGWKRTAATRNAVVLSIELWSRLTAAETASVAAAAAAFGAFLEVPLTIDGLPGRR